MFTNISAAILAIVMATAKLYVIQEPVGKKTIQRINSDLSIGLNIKILLSFSTKVDILVYC